MGYSSGKNSSSLKMPPAASEAHTHRECRWATSGLLRVRTLVCGREWPLHDHVEVSEVVLIRCGIDARRCDTQSQCSGARQTRGLASAAHARTHTPRAVPRSSPGSESGRCVSFTILLGRAFGSAIVFLRQGCARVMARVVWHRPRVTRRVDRGAGWRRLRARESGRGKQLGRWLMLRGTTWGVEVRAAQFPAEEEQNAPATKRDSGVRRSRRSVAGSAQTWPRTALA